MINNPELFISGVRKKHTLPPGSLSWK